MPKNRQGGRVPRPLHSPSRQTRLPFVALAALALAVAAPAHSQPRTIDLGLFQEDMRISNNLADGDFGVSVAGGDANGDGYGDVLGGAETLSTYYLAGGGAFLVFGGSPLRRLVDLRKPDGRVVLWGNGPQDYTGWFVDLFDFNGDGLDDVWIGAPQFNWAGVRGNDAHGKIYCLWGRKEWPPELFLKDSPENGGATLHGQYPWARFGYALAHGDVDGDGFQDLVTAAAIGRPDRPVGNQITAYVVFGGQPLPSGRIHDLAVRKTLIFPPNVHLAILALSVADMDGDGLDDVALRFVTANVDSAREAGIIYVLWGRRDWPSVIDLGRWKQDPYVTALYGTTPGANYGAMFASGNFGGGDGPDVAVMMHDAVRARKADYVEIYPDLLCLRPKEVRLPDPSRMAAAASDLLHPYSLTPYTAVLDWDDDGFDDLVLSDTRFGRNPRTRLQEGVVYVLFGGQALPPLVNLLAPGEYPRVAIIFGGSFGGWAGRDLGTADVNGDGKPDLIVGAWGARTSTGDNSGEVYVLLGGKHEPGAAAPAALQLLHAYPNPFNSQTVLSFDLPEAGRVRLAIYNVRGWPVRTLIEAPLSAGRHTAIWNGRDDKGVFAGSGVYFARLFAGQRVATRKLLYLK